MLADPASIISAVHLIVPFAAASSDAAREMLSRLATPALDALLACCEEAGRDDGDEWALDAPHERALARAFGWRADAPLPWAARQAHADGIDVGQAPWGLLTPVHWRVGSDGVHLADPDALALSDADSRALCEAARPLFVILHDLDLESLPAAGCDDGERFQFDLGRRPAS